MPVSLSRTIVHVGRNGSFGSVEQWNVGLSEAASTDGYRQNSASQLTLEDRF
jgi:hypothetical protein